MSNGSVVAQLGHVDPVINPVGWGFNMAEERSRTNKFQPETILMNVEHSAFYALSFLIFYSAVLVLVGMFALYFYAILPRMLCRVWSTFKSMLPRNFTSYRENYFNDVCLIFYYHIYILDKVYNCLGLSNYKLTINK